MDDEDNADGDDVVDGTISVANADQVDRGGD
jgi:hypothetical protein